jgi:hypothetical protein
MFFSVFWTVYIPVVTIIFSVVIDWLVRSLRRLRAHASLSCSDRRKSSSATNQGRLLRRHRRCEPPIGKTTADHKQDPMFSGW